MSEKFTIITASAGSGKTYTITHDMGDRLGTGQLDPGQIIATTFTKAAAAEMSGRVRQVLLDRGMLEQAQAIDTALIGTVNSIAARILTDYAIESGVSPDVKTLDPEAARRAFNTACGDYITGVFRSNRELFARTGMPLTADEGPHADRYCLMQAINQIVQLARANNISATALKKMGENTTAEFTATMGQLAEQTGISPAGNRSANAGFAASLEQLACEVREEVAAFQRDKESTEFIGNSRAIKGALEDADNCDGLAARIRQLRAPLPWGDYEREITKLKLRRAAGNIRAQADRTAAVWSSREFLDDYRQVITTVFTAAADCLRLYSEFKRVLGMIDYTDQEQGALEQLRCNKQVRDDIAETYRLLVVDEFQDTSPLQLALFLEIADLVDHVVWVGDPKQSIYRFRGADAKLMKAVIDAIPAKDKQTRSLTQSHRSQPDLVTFSNELFSRVFAHMPGKEVRLANSAEAEADKATDPGEIVFLTTLASNAEQRKKALAEFMAREENRRRRDNPDAPDISCAVLGRTNGETPDAELAAVGLPVSGETTDPFDTREGQLLRAALTALVDPTDTLAIMELVAHIDGHPAHDDWFDRLAAIVAGDAPDGETHREKLHRDTRARRQQVRRWFDTDDGGVFAELRAVRDRIGVLSLAEAVKTVARAIRLDETIAGWTTPDARLRTLTSIVTLAEDYASTCQAKRKPATLSGLVSHFHDDFNRKNDPDSAPPVTTEAGAINTGTIHKAKGLGWDEVYYLATAKDKFSPSGQWVTQAQQLDLSDPLAGREIRFWPRLPLTGATTRALQVLPPHREQYLADLEENQRVSYVAVTRAKKKLVVVVDGTPRKKNNIFTTPFDIAATCAADGEDAPDTPGGKMSLAFADTVPDAEEDIPDAPLTITGPDGQSTTLSVRRVSIAPPADDASRTVVAERVKKTPAGSRDSGVVRAPSGTGVSYRFAASSTPSTPHLQDTAGISVFADLGGRLVDKGGAGWNMIGNAVHAYLACPYSGLDETMQHTVAARLIDGYGVAGTITAHTVITAGRRWSEFVHTTFADRGYTRLTEVPFMWRNDAAQVAEGWMDELVRLGDGDGTGFVVVDHKTYPGHDPVGHVRDNYLGQMDVYCRAIAETTGKKPEQILIHMPLIGKVLAVTGL
ncbi:UvrD-helicase domain-containing protein [Corynebacterium mendelii]|uniref:DNA 3'-5' helicase n=1 Tax=Corynebacterium mendelii TaxID=2765362 RepID=A0A939DZM7_9CORY|nr:UvrD-helicase domain-containing protein [Corynebacterium mendelii]MBN9643158.1 UvrD-helicase domain-containing protein [Corynebacterium mendelii]